MRFCVLASFIFVLLMAANGAECGCFQSKDGSTAGGGQNTQCQQRRTAESDSHPLPTPSSGRNTHLHQGRGKNLAPLFRLTRTPSDA
uniref:Secreted protein n=1 Tax=Globodera pallida TaxID=36090 RepID=A0A183C3Y5_GLOPA